jgi:hypothetical protein
MCEIHKHIYRDQGNAQVFLDYEFTDKICKRIESEINKTGILAPVTPQRGSVADTYTLADEPLSLLTSSPPSPSPSSSSSSSSSLHPNVFFFLFINEFCLTISDFPNTRTEQIQTLVESSIPAILLKFIQFLTKITTAKLLIGKTGLLIPQSNTGSGLNALIGAMKKLTTNASFVDPTKQNIVNASPNMTQSSNPSSVSIILSDVYHSFAYSSLSALFNLMKFAEQGEVNSLADVDGLNSLFVILNFVIKAASFFLPSSSSSSSSSPVSPHYFPSFLVKGINLVEVSRIALRVFVSKYILFYYRCYCYLPNPNPVL